MGLRHNGNPLKSCEEDNPCEVDETPFVGRVNTSSPMSHKEKENLPRLITYLQRLPCRSESPPNFSVCSFSLIRRLPQRSPKLQACHTPQWVPFIIPSGSFTKTPLWVKIDKFVHISWGNWISRHSRKGRDKDRDQGHLRARASLEQVEIEMKKTRGASHLEKFMARALDGHDRFISF